MKKILLITTGGTIASKNNGHGLTPELSSAELLDFVPEIKNICSFDSLELFNLDSTNIEPSHWLKIVEAIEKNYNLYDGFVITHGTDTLSYTAAALSYLIQNSRKPIVLTGSQKSIYLRDSDARQNLLDAFIVASSHITGVKLVFNGKIILGTRARKTRTQSYNAFDSIDFPEIASIKDKKIITYIKEEPSDVKPLFYNKIDNSILCIKLIPGMKGDIIKTLGKSYKAIIIEAFGMGGLPNLGNNSLREAVDLYTKEGGLVIITTQVPYEGSSLSTYKVGKELCENPNILEGGSMTMEALTCKLMWILGQSRDKMTIKEMFYKEISYDRI